MITENLLMRSLRVIERLRNGRASLEELANEAKCRAVDLKSSLRVLAEQGLIQQVDERYILIAQEQVGQLLAMTSSWISHFNADFYDIARDAAQAILEKSWEATSVIDVLLYGSTLTGAPPEDIDLLIIHEGGVLKYFSPYKPLRVDEPVGEENARDSAYSIFRQLGYREGASRTDTVVRVIGKRIEGLHVGTFTDEEIAERTEWYRDYCSRQKIPFDPSNRLDVYGINHVFDVNILSVWILKADQNDVLGLRKKAIEVCRDPTFWYTVLSTARIYDREAHDFTQTVEHKYPGVLQFFPSE